MAIILSGAVSAATSPQPVTTSLPTSQSSIDGHKVVYTQTYDSNTNDNDIYMKDLSTNTTSPVNGNYSDSENPDISGNIVVWQSRDSPTSNWQIYYRDMSNSSQNNWTGTLVYSNPNIHQTNPRISGNIVTWMQGPYSAPSASTGYQGDWDVMAYDLSTHAFYCVTGSDLYESDPDISGNTIAYERFEQNGSNWVYNVYKYTLGAPIDSGTHIYSNSIYSQHRPRIDGSHVVWEQETGGSNGHDIWYQNDINNPATGYLVSSPFQSYEEFNPQISGTTVIWERAFSDSDHDVIMKDCSSNNNPYQIVANSAASESQPAIGIDLYGIFVSYTSNTDGTVRVYWQNLDNTSPLVVANPTGDLYNTAKNVVLTACDSDSICTIYYTTDGSDPTTSGTRNIYSRSSIPISTTTTLRFSAVDPAGNWGPNYSETYTIDTTAPMVTANPSGGPYNTGQNVVLTTTDPDSTFTTYYTTDNSDPQTSGTRNVYAAAIPISTTTTLKFRSVDPAGNWGPNYSQTYTIDTTYPTVTANPSGGLYNTTQNVVLTTSDPDSTATTYYTTDGSDPLSSNNSNRHVYTAAIPISATTTLKFAAVDPAGNWASYFPQTYTIDTTAPTVTANPIGGLHNTTQNVVLTTTDPDSTATTYYTTDGTDPSSSTNGNRHVYSSAIPISTTTTLRFAAVDPACNWNSYTQTYTIDTTAPTVTANPSGGGVYWLGYPLADVVLTTADPDSSATTYYTTDGSDPQTSSNGNRHVYSAAIPINSTTTLRFSAIDPAGNWGPNYTKNYVVDYTAPTVTANPVGDLYNTSKNVVLTATDPDDATLDIIYTTDGSDPGNSGTRLIYTAAIPINTTTTLRFIVFDPAGNFNRYSETYTIDTTAPIVRATPTGGLSNTAKNVVLITGDPDSTATTYYTTDGTDPSSSTNGNRHVYSSAIPITTNTTLKYTAVDPAGNWATPGTQTYTFDTTAPIVTANPTGGTYNTAKSVTLTTTDPDSTATTYYTTDGSDPQNCDNGNQHVYSSAIPISTTTTLRFSAVDSAGNWGPNYSQTYTFDTTAPTVTANPTGGLHNTIQNVILTTMDPDSTATTYYTTDGTDPSSSTNDNRHVYSSAIPINTTTTLRFAAVDPAGNWGTNYIQNYVIDTTPPTSSANPRGGYYNSLQTVSLTTFDPDSTATTYYTTDGSDPQNSNAKSIYTSAIPISTTTSLSFRSVDPAGNWSPLYNETYVIDVIVPTASASPAGGYYNTTKSVTLNMSEPGKIYYTKDGTIPSISNTIYTAPIAITATTILKFLAKDLAGNISPIYNQTYNIDKAAPTATATPASGTYSDTVKVTLAMSEKGTIYYTTNGTTPTMSSTKYTAPFYLSSSKTLKFFARDLAGNKSPVYIKTYTVHDIIPPKVVSSSPTNNAIGVPVNQVIKITFSEPIKAGTAFNTITLKTSGGASVPINKTISKNVLTITLSSGVLKKGTKYILTLPLNSVIDLLGHSISAAYKLTFTTTIS